jgi:hypothetical protein
MVTKVEAKQSRMGQKLVDYVQQGRVAGNLRETTNAHLPGSKRLRARA